MRFHVLTVCLVLVGCGSNAPAPTQSDANCEQAHGEVLEQDGGLVCCFATDAGQVCLVCTGDLCQ